ncbi:YeiH family protein [Quadrisphaera sp. DSM 44207]|uniref:YeiH family protein n=1 Tax=Quadrisphaera sp. DSM 44207 TaxID=1881057 RepID=UPI000880C6EA|nr:putative sulfate exporter family transporter [Quadrisphaera sp. DSM 44207]SDQ15700.1 conserved hypothetical integral membrane protein [Quadrisphaera sp. DSM 44207]
MAVLPGLVLVAVATALALAVAGSVPGLGAPTAAVLLGAVVANTGLHRPVLRAGTRFAASRLLRTAVVLLGLQVALPQLADLGAAGLAVVLVTVAVTFTGTQLLGRALGVPRGRSVLVAAGFAICGASAVAAVRPVTDADDEDAAVAVALVVLCGSLAILLLPALRAPLGLDPAAFGAWVGASVHDVGQVVATASRVDGALEAAVVVKLARVVLLAPLVALVALSARRRVAAATGAGGVRRPPVVPLFVAGFLLAVAVASTGALPAAPLAAAERVQQVLLVAALVGLGTGVRWAVLRRTGGRALALGLGSWALVAATACAGVRLTGG